MTGENKSIEDERKQNKKRLDAVNKSRELAAEGSEIGTHPPVDRELYERYRYDLLAYLQECFPHSTGLKPFSKSHILAINRLQDAILSGGRELRIVFRGWAKSTLAENAATWAAGFGHCSFFVLIGADKVAATMALDSIQTEFSTNENLMNIFPQACWPVEALEGVPQRAAKQTMDGKLTRIQWNSEKCVLPTVDGFAGSGAIILPRGITANLRGLRFKTATGHQLRPDFVMVDDPQTDQSAASPTQNTKRLATLNKSILRLGGHDKDIAVVVNATIIEVGDMIDQLSNPKEFPGWRTVKVPMLFSFADAHEELWLGSYAELRTSYDPDDDDSRTTAEELATEFYRKNQPAMDKGAEASWVHCFNEQKEISAIQHAYNILVDTGEEAFMSECQNEPVKEESDLVILTPEQIINQRLSGFDQHTIPSECTTLVAHMDVHPGILYYHIWAFAPDETGYLITKGTFPDQRKDYFSHRAIRFKLSDIFPGTEEAVVTQALTTLIEELFNKKWYRTDGVPLGLSRLLVDANGRLSKKIKQALTRSKFAANLTPAYGKGVGAKHAPISRWPSSQGTNYGPEWVPTKAVRGESIGVIFDTNYWKTRFHQRLSLPPGTPGGLYLFGKSPKKHKQTAEQFTAETADLVSVGTRDVYEWKIKPNRDNHEFDTAVGSLVAASIAGIGREKTNTPIKKKKRKVRFLNG